MLPKIGSYIKIRENTMFPSNLSYYLTGVFSGVAIIVGVDFH